MGAAIPVAASSADSGGTPYKQSSSSNQATSAQASPKKQQTWSGTSFAPLGNRVPLRQGMHGKDVRVLQRLINDIGIKLGVDGQFGHATWAALRRIEKRAGRPVNGVLDSQDLQVVEQWDSSGGSTGISGDWHNEIHLNHSGCFKIARAWSEAIELVLEGKHLIQPTTGRKGRGGSSST